MSARNQSRAKLATGELDGDCGPRQAWFYEPWRAPRKAIELLNATEDEKPTAEAEQYREWLRHRAKTDLLFLGRVLGYTRLLERVHGPVAALGVDKIKAAEIIARAHETGDDPDSDEAKAAAEALGIRALLHLDPRKTFKTSLSITDSVQWIAVMPNIRICKLTATKPLATAIANEIRDHFVRAFGAETLFQTLFPELCISQREARTGEYTTPARTRNWKEATIMAFSNETSISGWHFDVMDPDDVVDTVNSATPAGVEKVKSNWRINRKTLMPWGLTNFRGTRYKPFDLWGDIIEKARPGKINLFIRGALKLKNGGRLQPGEFPTDKDMDLLFPELLPYEFLKTEFEDDYESFMSQYMNDEYGSKQVVFTREQILKASIPAERTPISGQAFMVWRLPCGSKPGMKFAAGAVGLLQEGRLYIIDVVQGSFAPSTLAMKVAQLARKHGVHAAQVENTPGAQYTEPAIRNYGAAIGWPLNVTWLEFQEDDGARDLRIKSAEPLIATGRLLFSESVGQWKEAARQFSHYGMIEENEIPDVVSRLCDVLPKSIVAAEVSEDDALRWQLVQERGLHDQIHGIGSFAPVKPIVEELPLEQPKSGLVEFGLADDLGGLNG